MGRVCGCFHAREDAPVSVAAASENCGADCGEQQEIALITDKTGLLVVLLTTSPWKRPHSAHFKRGNPAAEQLCNDRRRTQKNAGVGWLRRGQCLSPYLVGLRVF